MTTAGRFAALIALVLGAILIPFALYQDSIAAWWQSTVAGSPVHVVAAAVILLLALDVVLPVPSSLVSAGAGFALGFLPGALASAAGMTVGSVAGYAIGRRWGFRVANAIVGKRELEIASDRFRTKGMWAIALTRPVPVLAEACIVAAGIARVSPGDFLLVSAFANLGISLAYAGAGAFAAGRGGFLVAFAAAILFPYLAMRLLRRY